VRKMIMMLVCGCLDAGVRPEVLAVNVPGTPTDSISIRLSAPIDAESAGAVALVSGEAESTLVAALARPPAPARFASRLVAARVEVQGDTLLMMPRRALQPNARHTLVVGAGLRAGGSALGRPLVKGFVTGSLAEAAPVLSLVDPPDGAAEVIRNLRAIAVKWSKPMPAARFAILRDDGLAWPSHTDGLRIVLDRALEAGRRWTVQADVLDAEGRAPYGDPPRFSTGSELRRGPPPLDGLQLEVADRCLVARFATDHDTWAELCTGDRCRDDDRPAATHALGAPLAEAEEGWSLRVWDESTAPPARREGVVHMPPVPLVLTEVLTEPRGERLAQQWAEFFNVGDGPVELGGLRLCTAGGCDILPQASLPSGEYAVVVGAAFADDGLDAMPAPGAVVVRLGNQRLGGRGIRGGGEPLWLEDGGGTLITRWGGWPALLSPGQSLTRQPYNCDLPASFRPGPATPGSG
jgi:hypothetical protein